MKIGYSDKFQWGEPTNFRDKIQEGVTQRNQLMYNSQYAKPSVRPKIHTLRTDEKNRWPPLTNTIHHTYFNRSPKEDIFAITPCTGIQLCAIVWKSKQIRVLIDGHLYTTYPCPGKEDKISMAWPHVERMRELAWNDGFDSPEQFFRWFSKDWSGKIIHWTNKRYQPL